MRATALSLAAVGISARYPPFLHHYLHGCRRPFVLFFFFFQSFSSTKVFLDLYCACVCLCCRRLNNLCHAASLLPLVFLLASIFFQTSSPPPPLPRRSRDVPHTIAEAPPHPSHCPLSVNCVPLCVCLLLLLCLFPSGRLRPQLQAVSAPSFHRSCVRFLAPPPSFLFAVLKSIVRRFPSIFIFA